MPSAWFRRVHIVPGVSIVALGVAAFVSAVSPYELTPLGSAIAMLCAFIVGGLEIHLIYRDRAEGEQRHAAILERFTEMREVQAASLRLESDLRAAQERGSPPQSLKRRALGLADQILRFLGERQATEPINFHARPATEQEWRDENETSWRHLQTTISEYSRMFGGRARAILGELKEAGQENPELLGLIMHPTNSISIRMAGERIGALAERLPD